MIKHNYHSHTDFCNHSQYTPEQLIVRAIDAGLKTMGVSEHINLPSEVGQWRLRDEDALKEYIKVMNDLKDEYGDKIRILTGLESEITDPNTGKILTDWINEHAAIDGIDYVILGHHQFYTGKHCFYDMPNADELTRYVEDFKAAVNNKNILYVGHPDGFLKGAKRWTPELKAASREMIRAAVKADKPLGMNVNGFSYGLEFCYPDQEYFDMVGEEGGKVIIELDVHDEKPFQEEVVQKVLDMAAKAKVEIIERIL